MSITPQECHKLVWEESSWDKIPYEKLDQSHIEYKSAAKGTILHAAAKYNKFSKIPQKFHTVENYSQLDKDARTVFEVALLYKSIWQMPKDILNPQSAQITCRGIDSRSFYSHILDYLREEDFPKEWAQPKLLMLGEFDEYKYIHQIARRGWLRYLPKESFTEELVKLKDTSGLNLLHYAARYEGIGVLPKEFLTPSNLAIKASNGRTPLHWALANRRLRDQIPNNIISKELLSIQDDLGETCFHIATNSGCLDNIDARHITEEVLSIKDKKGKSSLDILLNSYYTDINIGNLKLCMKALSVKTLKDIIKQRKEENIIQMAGHELVKRGLATSNKGIKERTLEI